MEISEILINNFQGKLYSKKSGDTNKIHTDEVVGYNSIYGEKICHGCFVFEKFLKNIKIKNCNQIYMNFEKHFSYNQKIKILDQFQYPYQTINSLKFYEKIKNNLNEKFNLKLGFQIKDIQKTSEVFQINASL